MSSNNTDRVKVQVGVVFVVDGLESVVSVRRFARSRAANSRALSSHKSAVRAARA